MKFYTTLMDLPPIIVSSYSSPSLKVLELLDIKLLVLIVQLSPFCDISIVGDEVVIIFLATQGIPVLIINSVKTTAHRKITDYLRYQWQSSIRQGSHLCNS